MNVPTLFLGEIAALSAACLWAMSTMIYGRVGVQIPPLSLNLLKGSFAFVLLVLTLIVLNLGSESLSARSIRLLLLSGALGIGIGDTAYFQGLKGLGARKVLLLETLSAPLVAAIAFIFLGEGLQLESGFGIALILFGVAWVISERAPDAILSPEQFRRGLSWGLLAQLSQASGAVLSRAALAGNSISPIWSSLLRLGAGLVVVGLWQMLRPSQRDRKPSQWSPHALGFVALAAFGGTYLAMILQQTAFKYSSAGIAQTLLATSPLFILPLAALGGDRISLRSILGTLIAIAGIFLLFR